ncbi:cation:proton antiporter [Prauserella endophytica]|uniref:Cation/H+ exchanger transmembrane domain-containing protein n=1 Tax=Prauserella endophytica TaxID=1592324 RepID=A0ABY2S1N2_9PSEU|nr:cation:proton antiporter [Prauserella endophytica]TKG68355.1 hypothetical protein FCN18_21600 [Prauserella endophytica]
MTTTRVSSLLLSLAVVLTVARVMGALARRLGSRVWSESSSVACCSGPPCSARRTPGSSFPPTSSPLLNALANVGIALFMFLIGLELERRLVRERGRGVVSVSLGSVRVAFALGVLLGARVVRRRRSAVFTLFLGVAMSATSFPVLARILADRWLSDSRLGGLSIANAAVCDRTVIVAGVLASSALTEWMGLRLVFGAFCSASRPPHGGHAGPHHQDQSHRRAPARVLLRRQHEVGLSTFALAALLGLLCLSRLMASSQASTALRACIASTAASPRHRVGFNSACSTSTSTRSWWSWPS